MGPPHAFKPIHAVTNPPISKAAPWNRSAHTAARSPPQTTYANATPAIRTTDVPRPTPNTVFSVVAPE